MKRHKKRRMRLGEASLTDRQVGITPHRHECVSPSCPTKIPSHIPEPEDVQVATQYVGLGLTVRDRYKRFFAICAVQEFVQPMAIASFLSLASALLAFKVKQKVAKVLHAPDEIRPATNHYSMTSAQPLY